MPPFWIFTRADLTSQEEGRHAVVLPCNNKSCLRILRGDQCIGDESESGMVDCDEVLLPEIDEHG